MTYFLISTVLLTQKKVCILQTNWLIQIDLGVSDNTTLISFTICEYSLKRTR